MCGQRKKGAYPIFVCIAEKNHGGGSQCDSSVGEYEPSKFKNKLFSVFTECVCSEIVFRQQLEVEGNGIRCCCF